MIKVYCIRNKADHRLCSLAHHVHACAPAHNISRHRDQQLTVNNRQWRVFFSRLREGLRWVELFSTRKLTHPFFQSFDTALLFVTLLSQFAVFLEDDKQMQLRERGTPDYVVQTLS